VYHAKKQEVKYNGTVVRKGKMYSPYEKRYWEVGVE